MIRISQLLKYLVIGSPAEAAANSLYMRNVNIDTLTGAISTVVNPKNSMILTNQAGSTAVVPLLVGQLKAEKIWNSVWNDLADFQDLIGELAIGKCYRDTKDGAVLCNERCQMGVIGIASDTFGFAIGNNQERKQVPIAIGGWALAFVDKEYPSGTPLTNDEYGCLTEMLMDEKRDFPERIVATYKKIELSETFGSDSTKVKVTPEFLF